MAGILVVGDSNSAPPWIRDCRPWWQRLGDRLVGERDGATAVQCAAIGGSQLHMAAGRTPTIPPVETHALDVLAQLEAAGTLPGLLMVCGGTNDLAVEYVPQAEWPDVALSVENLAETVRNRWDIPTFVISCLPMRVGGILSQQVWEQREPRRRALNASLKTVFGPSGMFFDAEPVVGEGMSGSVQIWSPYVHDALHLNTFGHLAIGDRLPLEHLRKLAGLP